MEKFNENPFNKFTEVTPFSNGSEAMIWRENNCDKCLNYEDKSKEEIDAKCKLAFNIDIGFVKGHIPLWVAKEIGCDYNPLYQTCNLHKCRKYLKGNEPF